MRKGRGEGSEEGEEDTLEKRMLGSSNFTPRPRPPLQRFTTKHGGGKHPHKK